MSTPQEETIAYPVDQINSLGDLERSCERDEAQHFSNVKGVKRATNNGKKVTAVTYVRVPNFNMGHLTIVEYKTEVDKQSLKATHQAAGETFVCEGGAFVGGAPVEVLVFREKPAS